jgi:hypothetical protein
LKKALKFTRRSEFQLERELKKILSLRDSDALLQTLGFRFRQNMGRHPSVDWGDVLAKLEASLEKLWSLSEMERTGGDPDVVGREGAERIVFVDCSPETPKGRINLCYDREALDTRKEHKPLHNAVDMAAAMGVELLTEEEYIALQNLGEFDRKTSSWLKTPDEIRKLGGAIFGDRRFGRAFIYHNGAASYFSSRGFRASVRI